MSEAIKLANQLDDKADHISNENGELSVMREAAIELRILAEIEQAAIKLVKCKGRYHTEQNMVALAKLVGVTLPPVKGKDD